MQLRSSSQKEIDLREIIRVIFRHKYVILACFLTIMVSVYIALDLRLPTYRSSVRMLVAGTMQTDLDVTRSLGPGSLIATQMSLVRSRPILERTVKALKLHQRPLDYKRRRASTLKKLLIDEEISKIKLDLETMTPDERQSFLINRAVGELDSNISTYWESETSIFNIVVRDFNPRDAGRIANVLSRSFVIFDLEQQIASLKLTYGNKNETIIKLRKHIERMEETLDGRILPDIEAIGPATVKIINQAGPGRREPMKPSMTSGMIAAFMISIVLGVTLSFVFDLFDMTFKSANDVTKYLDISYLGSIPKRKAGDKLLLYNDKPTSKYSLLLQRLSHKIYLLMKEQNLKTLLLADADQSQEAAIITANIGTCLAYKAGYKVLIIDADMRSPSMHEMFNVTNSMGLADLIPEKRSLAGAVHDLGLNLDFIPAGDTSLNPIALLRSDSMSEILKEARKAYEIVLVNCTNIKDHSDVLILSSCTDGVLFSINEGTSRRQIVQNSVDPFKQRDIKILGVILNNHKYVIPEMLYRIT